MPHFLSPGSNPVLKAYADSLETQVASLRTELSDAYKAQGQATLKLLSLTEVRPRPCRSPQDLINGRLLISCT